MIVAVKALQSVVFRRVLAGALIVAGIAGSGWLAYGLALRSGFDRLQHATEDRLSLLQLTVDATIERFRYLPTALAQAAPILNVYQKPDSQHAKDAANRYLKSLNDAAGSSDIYVVDRSGVALAASNYLEGTNFIGKNYAFRPYFTEALKSSEGRYYAVGATTGKPGYFLWHSATDEAGTLGVAVVKVDLHPLQDEWKRTGDLVAMVDPNGVIFLTSRPTWQYRPISHLSATQLKVLRETRQYGQDIDDLNPLFDGQRIERGMRIVHVDEPGVLPGRDYLVFSRLLPAHGWNLVVLVALRSVQEQAAIIAAAVMLAVLATLLTFLVTHQRRLMVRAKLNAHHVLEVRVSERTAELAATNGLLSAEIGERIRTEQDLRLAQDNLVHATKMASLGQALAGVAHEINQSLAALTTYIAGARVLLSRNEKDRTLSNLDLVSAIVTRMGALTQHLKSFARKDTASKQATDLGAAIRYALSLVDYRIAEQDVTLTLRLPERPVYAMGNAVRLEQVIVNLVSNALDAMRDRPQRDLLIDLQRCDRSAVLKVADTGRGIAPEQLSSVFDPFYTTKDVGQGLGLGLSISYGIIRDMDGEITVASEVDRGTTFRVALPLVGALVSQTAVVT
ncbi:MAG TPA: ATP-binding protein [Steroidobacteraceae bacterium]|jgi:two-component system C4-dicarboxylate transport sensor histidine kinase DctB